MTRDSQQIIEKNHMLCLPKPDTPVWQTGTSGFTRKTGPSGLENRTLRFFQTQHIDKTTFKLNSTHLQITFRHE